MKKQFLTFVFMILIATTAFGQQWLNIASGANANWVNLGDLDVPGNSITVEALVSWQNASPNIVSKHRDFTLCNYLLRTNGMEITTSSGYKRVPNPSILCIDSVYHIAGTYDGDSMKFYVNGLEVSSVAWTGNLILNNLNTAIGNIAFGLNEQFLGFIDEVRIWNVARTQTEIANNMYDLPNPTSQTGLLAYYKFDGNYSNIQGSTIWDGTASGSQLSLLTNPYFTGTVSNNFCSIGTGIFENNTNATFKIYPNPTKGNFFIDMDEFIMENSTAVISNQLGQILQIFKPSQRIFEMDVDLPNGIYFLTLSTEKEFYSAKIIVHHNRN